MKLPEGKRRSYEPPARKPQEGRKVDNSKLYNSRAWRNFRKQYLEANPLCVHCEKEGIITAATVLDHIKQVRAGGDPFSLDNVQPLCAKHHNRKSGKERWKQGN